RPDAYPRTCCANQKQTATLIFRQSCLDKVGYLAVDDLRITLNRGARHIFFAMKPVSLGS
ncbi:hypothetical protein, partial [Mesorhizobium sp.]|uniref:hypothetical protein n=1 Tax=Mesorhizobium sp. TaxID=1871066 RepID=UPI00257AB6A7